MPIRHLYLPWLFSYVNYGLKRRIKMEKSVTKIKWLKRSLTVIGIIILLFLLFIGYGIGISNRWYKLLIITSDSMNPVFKAGDLICITKVDNSKLKPGDIVVFQTNEGGFITHRVVKINNGEIITKGDANNANDAWNDGWKLRRVNGIYLFSIPKIGYPISWWNRFLHETVAGALLKR